MFLPRCVAGSLMLSLFPFHRRPSQSASRSGEWEFLYSSVPCESCPWALAAASPTRGH